METETIVRNFICNELLRGSDPELHELNGSLISSGILDSLALLKLLVFIEERFSLKIKDGEVTPTNFETIHRITAFIEGKKTQATG